MAKVRRKAHVRRTKGGKVENVREHQMETRRSKTRSVIGAGIRHLTTKIPCAVFNTSEEARAYLKKESRDDGLEIRTLRTINGESQIEPGEGFARSDKETVQFVVMAKSPQVLFVKDE